MMRQKTLSIKHDEVPRQWHLIDADGQVLGRLASRVAILLRGKHKAIFTPHVDCGDGVIVINAQKIKVTGRKLETKIYTRYSGYPGGLKKESLGHLLDRRPTEVFKKAVVGMLPHNPLGRQVFSRLRIYPGAEHPHAAQLNVKQPKESSKKKA